MFEADHYHEDPATGRAFAVNARDATADEVADDVRFSPFTGEALSVEGEEGEPEEPEDEAE